MTSSGTPEPSVPAVRRLDTPVALVLPWYGPDTAGGAEAHARQLARALRQAGVAVEVWTTTARDARAPLEPYYAGGWSTVDDIPVRRFPATLGQLPGQARRAPARFGLDRCPIHEWQLLESLTSSDELLNALEAERLSKRWIFFLYAFPTTFFGAQLVGDRAALIPCLHDEPYAQYSTTCHLLRRVRLVLANSRAEVQLIQQVVGSQLHGARLSVKESILPHRVMGRRSGMHMGLKVRCSSSLGGAIRRKIFLCCWLTSSAAGLSTDHDHNWSLRVQVRCTFHRHWHRGFMIWAS